MESKKIKINLASFDLAKGIAILLVVIFHTSGHYDWSQSGMQQAIMVATCVFGTGILTAFFIITGFGMKAKPPKALLKKSFSDLIVPYLWIMAAYAVVFPLVRYPITGSWPVVLDQAARFVIAFLLGYARYGKVLFSVQIFWCTAAWFLLATFVALNVLNLILQLKNQLAQVVCVVLCAVIGNLLFSVEFFYFCIPQGLRAVGYIYIGYLIKKYDLFGRLQSNVWTYVALLPFCLLEMKLGTLDNTVFINVFLEYFASACSAIIFILVFVYLGTFERKGLDWIKQAGIYSYWIICLHSAEMDIIPWHLNAQFFPQHPLLAFGIELLLKAAIFITGCALLKKIAKERYKRKLIVNGK